MIQFREKAGRTDRRTDDTKFIRPHYRGSKMQLVMSEWEEKVIIN